MPVHPTISVNKLYLVEWENDASWLVYDDQGDPWLVDKEPKMWEMV